MPLTPPILTNELAKFMDDQVPSFEGFPSATNVGQKWAAAVDAYASKVIPASIAAAIAKTAMAGAMAGASAPGAGTAAIPAAFAAYAATLGGGMAPAFVAVPPPAPLSLDPAFAVGMSGGSASAVISQIVTIVDTWFRTGTATPALGGPPVPWS